MNKIIPIGPNNSSMTKNIAHRQQPQSITAMFL